MMLIACPFCGPRADIEFSYGAAAGLRYPKPDASEAELTDYLFLRDNPKGWHREIWVHRHGCEQWIEVERNTLTHEIRQVLALSQHEGTE